MRRDSRFVAPLTMSLGPLLLFGLIGCGGAKPITVQGMLSRGGQPVKVKADTSLMIMFARAEGEISRTTYPAALNPEDGTYTVSLPPGKYKVGVICPALQI